MIIKAGIDIVFIPRIQRLLDNPNALQRMLHARELSNLEPRHIAGVIAAKEAFFKALEMRPEWHEVEVTAKESGKPILLLSSALQKKVKDADCSISHDEEYAVASVVLVQEVSHAHPS